MLLSHAVPEVAPISAVSCASVSRERLIESYLHLVDALVSRVCARKTLEGLERDDLIQEGRIGLIEAADSFDASRGAQFSTYAMLCIRRALCGALRANARQPESESLELAALSLAVEAPDVDERLALKMAIERLDADKAQILTALYFRGHTKKHLAERMNCSPTQVERLHQTALSDLRRILGESFPD